MLLRSRFAIPLLIASLTLPGVVKAAPTVDVVSGNMTGTPPSGFSSLSVHGSLTITSSASAVQHAAIVVGGVLFGEVVGSKLYPGFDLIELSSSRSPGADITLMFFPSASNGSVELTTESGSTIYGSIVVASH